MNLSTTSTIEVRAKQQEMLKEAQRRRWAARVSRNQRGSRSVLRSLGLHSR